MWRFLLDQLRVWGSIGGGGLGCSEPAGMLCVRGGLRAGPQGTQCLEMKEKLEPWGEEGARWGQQSPALLLRTCPLSPVWWGLLSLPLLRGKGQTSATSKCSILKLNPGGGSRVHGHPSVLTRRWVRDLSLRSL